MPKTRLPVFFLIIIAGQAFNAFSQPRIGASVIHDVYSINSAALVEERRILVHLPQSYSAGESRYPVVYMLDGHDPQPAMMGGILGQQAQAGQIPELILVSIQNTNRSRDLTPTDDGKGGTVGGAGKFLSFIKSEVFPLVEKNYRTHPFRIFAGHSLGGLAVVYALASQPEMFNAYIAASPVLDYDDNFVIKETEKYFEQNRRVEKTIFLGLGDEPAYTEGWKRFKKLLKDKKPDGFEYEFREFPEENHGSVVLQAYYRGLRKIYENWVPQKAGSLSELEDHYKKLTKKYGYEILIPEGLLNQIGYQLLRSGKTEDAITIFSVNVKNYPKSANVYDSLGEAYEKNNSKKKARDNYEKAYQLALEQGDERLASSARKNLERVSN